MSRTFGVLVCCALWVPIAMGGQGTPSLIPPGATLLEGTPAVKVEVTEAGARRHMFGAREAAGETLSIRVKDGALFWARADGTPLTLTTAGDMTYLSSAAEPGRYVRLRRLHDKLTYVEHVDLGSRSVTYWGEVRVTLGR